MLYSLNRSRKGTLRIESQKCGKMRAFCEKKKIWRCSANNTVTCLEGIFLFHEFHLMARGSAIIHLNSIIIISGLEDQRFKDDASGYKANQTKFQAVMRQNARKWQATNR